MQNATKVITGKVRFSYLNVLEKKATVEGGIEKFSTSIIIPKTDTQTIAKINAAIEAAYKEGEGKLRGNAKVAPTLASIHLPLRDGSEKPDDPAYKDCYFLNASSISPVGVVDAALNPILDPKEIYSGMYGRVSISFYAYNKDNLSRGIAVGLNNIQKLSDGDHLGGKASAEKDFATDDAEDFLD